MATGVHWYTGFVCISIGMTIIVAISMVVYTKNYNTGN